MTEMSKLLYFSITLFKNVWISGGSGSKQSLQLEKKDIDYTIFIRDTIYYSFNIFCTVFLSVVSSVICGPQNPDTGWYSSKKINKKCSRPVLEMKI